MTIDLPRLLMIETSGSPGQVALARGEAVCAVRTLDQARQHARDLAPAVRQLLRDQDWRPRDISAVFVSQGPGSYTGLRVGIMSAKAFCYATGCTLLGIDTFAAIALGSAESTAPAQVCVIADAQQEKVYCRRFLIDPDALPVAQPVAQTPLEIRPLADWLASLPSDYRITGPGVRVFRRHLPEEKLVLPEELWTPAPESLLRLGLDRLARGEREDFWNLEPLYARPSSAEEKWSHR